MQAQALEKQNQTLDDLPILSPRELPDEDGIPMENFLHRLQQQLLLDSLRHHWQHKNGYFAGANMFVYFSLQQAHQILRGEQTAYRGPDFFVVLNTFLHPPRTKWAVWAEGGKTPDVIVELLTPSQPVWLGARRSGCMSWCSGVGVLSV